MPEKSLLKKIEALNKEIVEDNSIDVTDEFNRGQKEKINRVKIFFKSIDKDFDTDKFDNLKVHLENVFLFQNGPLGRLLAASDANDVILSRKLLTKPEYVKNFAFIHEVVHFLTNNKRTEIDKKVYSRSGHNIRHLELDKMENKVVARRNFFELFNEGTTDYITILILGDKFKFFFRSKFDFGHKKLYQLASILIESVKDNIDEKNIIKDYINRGAKFLQAIRKKHGKHSITILSQVNEHNLDDAIEFFQTDDIKRKEELRKKLFTGINLENNDK